jgi:hypothetical protein
MNAVISKKPIVSRKRKSTNVLPIILFIALVVFAGIGLAATGHLSNPFGFLTQSQRHAGGPPMSANNQVAANSNASGNAQFSARGTDDGGGDSSSISIDWSQITTVLFNLWYLCATTAVVIVVQKVGGYLVHQVKQRRQPLTA